MIFGNPVRGTIGLQAADPDLWFRSQPFGCTGFAWEPPLGSCSHYHRGVDIARGPAGCGDDLLAVQAGTVIYAGNLIGGSKAVVIRHSGGNVTGQSHMASIWAKAGAKVKQGTKIGTVGKTGNATGCHVHMALKTGFPTSGDVNDFYLDAKGKWGDIWPLLEQNVTLHPKDLDGINIRETAGSGSTLGAKYASTDNGRIIRVDGTDLGSAIAWRDWGGTVNGSSYPAGTGYPGGNKWERIKLAGTFRFVASPLAVLSAKK